MFFICIRDVHRDPQSASFRGFCVMMIPSVSLFLCSINSRVLHRGCDQMVIIPTKWGASVDWWLVAEPVSHHQKGWGTYVIPWPRRIINGRIQCSWCSLDSISRALTVILGNQGTTLKSLYGTPAVPITRIYTQHPPNESQSQLHLLHLGG